MMDKDKETFLLVTNQHCTTSPQRDPKSFFNFSPSHCLDSINFHSSQSEAASAVTSVAVHLFPLISLRSTELSFHRKKVSFCEEYAFHRKKVLFLFWSLSLSSFFLVPLISYPFTPTFLEWTEET